MGEPRFRESRLALSSGLDRVDHVGGHKSIWRAEMVIPARGMEALLEGQILNGEIAL